LQEARSVPAPDLLMGRNDLVWAHGETARRPPPEAEGPPGCGWLAGLSGLRDSSGKGKPPVTVKSDLESRSHRGAIGDIGGGAHKATVRRRDRLAGKRGAKAPGATDLLDSGPGPRQGPTPVQCAHESSPKERARPTAFPPPALMAEGSGGSRGGRLAAPATTPAQTQQKRKTL